MTRWIEADQVAEKLKPGMTVFVAGAKSTAFFATPQNRDSVAAGRVDDIPLQYRAIYDYL